MSVYISQGANAFLKFRLPESTGTDPIVPDSLKTRFRLVHFIFVHPAIEIVEVLAAQD